MSVPVALMLHRARQLLLCDPTLSPAWQRKVLAVQSSFSRSCWPKPKEADWILRDHSLKSSRQDPGTRADILPEQLAQLPPLCS